MALDTIIIESERLTNEIVLRDRKVNRSVVLQRLEEEKRLREGMEADRLKRMEKFDEEDRAKQPK